MTELSSSSFPLQRSSPMKYGKGFDTLERKKKTNEIRPILETNQSVLIRGVASFRLTILSLEVSAGSVPAHTQLITSLSDLHGPGGLQPHHSAEVAHVNCWQDPIGNVDIRKKHIFLHNIVNLAGGG